MKNLLLLLVSILIGISVIIGYYGLKKNTGNVTNVTIPKDQQTIFLVEQAPSESKKGIISSMSGTVEWESRIATIPAQLTTQVPIKQGESLITADDGQVSMNFSDIGSVILAPKSKIEFIQTLPDNFVVNQSTGTIHYQKTGSTPMAIRSFHLLITMTGAVTITVDKDTGIITVTVNSGSITAGFNDLQYVSHVININSGQKYIFDDTLRTGTLE